MGVDALVPSVDIPEIGSPGLIWDDDNWNQANWGGAAYEHTLNTTDIVAMDIKRGRRSVFDQMPAGTATLMLNNEDGQFTPEDIPVGQSIRIIGNRVAFGSSDVFEGTLQTVREVIDNVTQRDALLLVAVDPIRETQDETVLGTLVQATVKNRIDALLDIVGSSFGRSIGAATNVMPEVAGSTAFGGIQEAANADGGVFYVSSDGIFIYLSESTLFTASRYASPVVTMSDATASLFPVGNLQTDYSVDRVINRFTIETPAAGTTSAVNGASETLHGPRGTTVTRQLASLATATTLAQRLANLGAAQVEQLQPVTVNASKGNWESVLASIDLQDPVDVTRGATTTSYVVQGLKHSWRPSTGWDTTFELDSSIPAEAT